MRLLLDTHALLWSLGDDLDERSTAAVVDPSSEVFVSSAAIWEIAIKQASGKLKTVPAATVADLARSAGFEPLAVTFEHAAGVAELPPLHRDPFDRLLISQALSEGLTLATADHAIARYDVPVLGIAQSQQSRP